MALVSRFLMYKLRPPNIMIAELFPGACVAWMWVQAEVMCSMISLDVL